MWYRHKLNTCSLYLSVLVLWCLLPTVAVAQSQNLQPASFHHEPLSFHREIVPLLTKAGCNAGACHGAAAGRGGFHLSLFGGSPAEDYHAIVHQLEGRRIHRRAPEQSLILRKPLGELDHGGDHVLVTDSLEYDTLRTWLRQGAVFDVPRPLDDFRVLVEEFADSPVPHYQLKSLATLEGMRGPRDVTSFTQFTVTDPDSVELATGTAAVKLLRPGQHVIIARYLDRIQAITLTRPYPSPVVSSRLSATNFIDREINQTLSELNLPAGAPIGDAEFLRRVTIDLTGRLPEPEDVKAFVASARIDKRLRVVDRLLSSAAFNDYWTLIVSRWLRLHSLPNDSQGADTFGKWIRESIAEGASWRDMTRQLLTASGDSHVVGPANFCRMVGDPRAHAEVVSEVFLGARMGCANCHDHPLDRWTQDDYHGLAAMLARIDRGRQVQFTSRGDVTNPKSSMPARWRLPGTSYVEPNVVPTERLAQWMTGPDQTRLARSYVNRIWSEVFGRGLVETVDDMRDTNPATHPELLDILARQLVVHDYDLRCLLRWLVTTEAYARSSTDKADKFYGFRESRPLSAHVLADAIGDVTGVPLALSRMPLGTRAMHVLDPLSPAPALDILGRCNRAGNCAASKSATGLATQLHLINGDLINRTLDDPQSRLMRRLASNESPSEVIQEFHLRAFGVRATDEQIEQWAQQLDSSDPQERRERLQDWLWSVLSSRRFQFNH